MTAVTTKGTNKITLITCEGEEIMVKDNDINNAEIYGS